MLRMPPRGSTAERGLSRVSRNDPALVHVLFAFFLGPHSGHGEQVKEEVVGERAGRRGEDAELRPVGGKGHTDNCQGIHICPETYGYVYTYGEYMYGHTDGSQAADVSLVVRILTGVIRLFLGSY